MEESTTEVELISTPPFDPKIIDLSSTAPSLKPWVVKLNDIDLFLPKNSHRQMTMILENI